MSDMSFLEDDAVQLQARLSTAEAELVRLRAIIDRPENDDFLKGVSIEAEHARRRWEKDDIAKTPFEWMGLVLFLAGKGLKAYLDGDTEKAKHHCVSSAAALLNFHRMIIMGNLSHE